MGAQKTGLKGSSFTMAHTLGRTTSLGYELKEIMHANHQLVGLEDGYSLSVCLSKWRSQLRTELTSNHHLSRRQPSLAASIPEVFPSAEILDLYVNPAIGKPPYVLPNWDVRSPDSAQMTRSLSQLFCWGWKRIWCMLQEAVWVGYMVQHLLEVFFLH